MTSHVVLSGSVHDFLHHNCSEVWIIDPGRIRLDLFLIQNYSCMFIVIGFDAMRCWIEWIEVLLSKCDRWVRHEFGEQTQLQLSRPNAPGVNELDTLIAN